MEKAMKKFEEYTQKLVRDEITLKQYTRMVKMINAITKKELGYK